MDDLSPKPLQCERLRIEHVDKAFGDNVALHDVGLSLNYGEVHAVVGENGAGKSTLMRILAGHLTADAGSMEFEGQQIDLSHAATGNRQGIGFVEQEGGLIAEFSGAENLIVAERNGFWSNRWLAGSRIEELGKQFGGSVDPHIPVQNLLMGQRQRLEILVTLVQGANVLILDEPTASLGTEDTQHLVEIIRKFVSEGGSVFYISHKLNEIMDIADRVTVLRKGFVVERHLTSMITAAQLAAEMVGEIASAQSQGPSSSTAAELIGIALGKRTEVGANKDKRVICALQKVSIPSPYRGESRISEVDFTVHAGEVVGIAGVVGNGQTVLAEVLAGLITPQDGIVRRDGGPIAYVPEDRHRDAVALSLSISDNAMVYFHRRAQFIRGLWPRQGAVNGYVETMLQSSAVHGGFRELPLSSLSGGNQQKLVLGRELEQKPTLLVAHNPFRGLDVRAIQNVCDTILHACGSGVGVVMISSDLEELMQLSHRIVVLFSGRIMGEVPAGGGQLELIGKMMAGLPQ
jgi:simple sugar transport system ATP-binding protein